MHFWELRQRTAGSWWLWTLTTWTMHGCCSDDCTGQCIFLQMNVSLDLWISGLLERFFFTRIYGAIGDDIIYCNQCTRHCVCHGFGISLRLELDGLAIWSEFNYSTHMYFDAMVWTVPFEAILLDKLVHIAWTMCFRRHSKRGKKVYGYTRCAVTVFGLGNACRMSTLEFTGE